MTVSTLRALALLTVAVGALLPNKLAAQDVLTLDQVMTAEEQARTGVDNLSQSEKAALESWITSWTRYVAEYTQEKVGIEGDVAYAGVGSGHWVSEVTSGGSALLLNDWSEWEISSTSRHLVSDWLPTTQVTVMESDQPQGEYAYLLVNRMEDEVALARYKGRR